MYRLGWRTCKKEKQEDLPIKTLHTPRIAKRETNLSTEPTNEIIHDSIKTEQVFNRILKEKPLGKGWTEHLGNSFINDKCRTILPKTIVKQMFVESRTHPVYRDFICSRKSGNCFNVANSLSNLYAWNVLKESDIQV